MNEQSNLKSHPQVGLLGLYYDPYINTIWLRSRVLSLTFRASPFVSIKKKYFRTNLCHLKCNEVSEEVLARDKEISHRAFCRFYHFVKINSNQLT